jgi:lipopolysaccharide export system protein LptA
MAFIALCTVACALPQAAFALKSDASQPIQINADRWEHTGDTTGNNGTSVYSGHVVITQGSIHITADKATLTLVDGRLTKAVLLGEPATFKQRPQQGEKIVHGQARRINYNAAANTVELFDNARVTQGARLIVANYIRYNTAQEKVIAHQSEKNKERVHVVIPPKSGPPR